MQEEQMQITLKIPDTLNTSEFDMKMFVAAKLYEGGKLSLGYAADVAGISKRAFAEMLGQYGVSLFSQTVDEVQADFENAEKLLR
jgi:predicted HTH domain antitoxin